MAVLIMELIPKEVILKNSKLSSKSNYAREKMLKKIRQFKQEEILNFYKTASS